jgi:N-methylhydantoinase A
MSLEGTRMTPYRLAVDIGGTFTDLVLEGGPALRTRKVLTTPRAPEQGVLEGTRLILNDAGLGFSNIAVFVHGTTLATNAVIERRGARTALIGTQGFRDVLEIGTESRYDQYDLSIQKPVPLVPRRLRFTVPERVDVDGGVRLPLDEAAVRALVPTLQSEGIESLAVAYIHGYANPAHEQRTAAILAECLPGVRVTLASDVAPEIREYERTSTAVANAYVQPLVEGYLARMKSALDTAGFGGVLYLVTSSGGLTTLEAAQRFPVRLIESGPAGGAIFATNVAAMLGEPRVLSFDMGGTTAKICLIQDFKPGSARFFEVDRSARFLKGSGLPLRIPVIEMVEIGAGGGSIARLDSLGSVAVGPESASSEPGPACYGRGGTRPAVTDADLVLGLLDPARFAGGTMTLQPEAARAALQQHVGDGLGTGPDMAAYAVHEMVCESMASAARVHAVERGLTASAQTVVAFGGAAPLHVARVAERIGARRVIVPPNAGVGSAVGFLAAPVAYEVVRSRRMRLDRFDPAGATTVLEALAASAHAVVQPGALGRPIEERRSAFMRYVGQGHEIALPLDNRPLTDADAATMRTAFEAAYAALFVRCIPGAAIEILSWSVLATTEATLPAAVAPPPDAAAPLPIGTRPVFDGRTGATVDVPVFDRTAMNPGARVPGPAIILEDETSTYVSARFDVHVDGAGCLVMEVMQ